MTALAGVAQLAGALSHRRKSPGFNSQSGCGSIPCWAMFEKATGCCFSVTSIFLSRIDVSFLHRCFSPFLSLKAMKKCPQVRIQYKELYDRIEIMSLSCLTLVIHSPLHTLMFALAVETLCGSTPAFLCPRSPTLLANLSSCTDFL